MTKTTEELIEETKAYRKNLIAMCNLEKEQRQQCFICGNTPEAVQALLDAIESAKAEGRREALEEVKELEITLKEFKKSLEEQNKELNDQNILLNERNELLVKSLNKDS